MLRDAGHLRMPWADRLYKFFLGAEESVQGAAAIEFAMIGPVLILMGIAVFDLGEAAYKDMQVQNAAQAGAEYALVHGFDAASISTAVTSATSFTGIGASPPPSQFCGCASETGVTSVSSCNTKCSSCNTKCSDGSGPGTYVTVSTQANYTTIIPYPLMPPKFTAQSTVRIQ